MVQGAVRILALVPSRPALALALLVVVATGCSRHRTPDPAYVQELERWRAERLADLTSDNGWLTLVGLFWLHPGANRFGSAPGNDLVLVGAGIPPVAGILDLADGVVTLRTGPESGALVDGSPATDQWLATDRSGKATVVQLGALRFHVIERAGRLGVRVKNPRTLPAWTSRASTTSRPTWRTGSRVRTSRTPPHAR